MFLRHASWRICICHILYCTVQYLTSCTCPNVVVKKGLVAHACAKVKWWATMMPRLFCCITAVLLTSTSSQYCLVVALSFLPMTLYHYPCSSGRSKWIARKWANKHSEVFQNDDSSNTVHVTYTSVVFLVVDAQWTNTAVADEGFCSGHRSGKVCVPADHGAWHCISLSLCDLTLMFGHWFVLGWILAWYKGTPKTSLSIFKTYQHVNVLRATRTSKGMKPWQWTSHNRNYFLYVMVRFWDDSMDESFAMRPLR